RESELAALQDSLRASRNGRPQVVSITATAGMGKTALLTEFLRHAELSGALVLRGRCHFREKVPYKALDGLIDDLSGYLRTCSSAQLADVLPARMYALQAVFPSLRRIPGGDASRFAQGVSASERHVAFVALGKLLTAIARTRPLVLAIDDLHWPDHDSLRALQTLLLGSARGFLVLLSYRPEGAPLD